MKKRGNYKFFADQAWYVPGVSGMFAVLGWFLVGALLANLLTLLIAAVAGAELTNEYGMLVAYPVMFIPPMMAAMSHSRANSFSDGGYALDSNHFEPIGGWLCALFVMLATFAAAFATDAINAAMPPMPAWLEESLNNMTGGKIWVDFLLVSIMAPFFEEWLCRGMILRGLLGATKIKPAWAIVISAAFFALIHMNPWQAIPAFILGCLFGYVYYKTGSLKLTMLMHFTNNTCALVASHIWPEAENWKDIVGGGMYWAYFVLALVVTGLVLLAFARIKPLSSRGGCDPVPSLFGGGE